MSDFVKAFIKFHGHVYLSKGVEQLDALRERLEEQFHVSAVTPPTPPLPARARSRGC